MQLTRRGIIDAIEAMGPSTIYVETDDQGQPRVVRLEATPRDGIAAAIRASIGPASADPDVEPPEQRTAALERCMDAMRELVRSVVNTERKRVYLDLSQVGGVVDEPEAMARSEQLDQRDTDAWATVRPALERFLAESAGVQTGHLGRAA